MLIVSVVCGCLGRAFYMCFVKQKTAYEMRISDWSSDVCSSDLREAKREAVLQTAARAFAENGYHRTSLEEIAARLGVSKPTIYYYAQNKDDLVAAIAARALDEIVAAMDADEQSSALSQPSHLLRR